MTSAIDLLINLDRSAGTSLHEQLCSELRKAITTGRLRPGSRLPATRLLAGSLRVGRLTVSLPMFYAMTRADVERVVAAVKALLATPEAGR